MMSQKEQAELLKKELEAKTAERIEIDVIKQTKDEAIREVKIQQSILKEQIAERGYIISVPDTEVILYEDDGYQLLYCNNIDHPGKITFLMALKQAARNLTGRTPITSQGYVAVPMPRDQFNLILASHQRSARKLKAMQERINELEKEIAPLKYIDHLLVKYKEDTK